MNRFKEALIQFAHSNPNLFPKNDTDTSLIEQQFSQFFTDFQTPNHPPYAAMIHRAIWELKEKGGSSEESISKYIEEEYVDLPWAHSTLLKHHLKKLCDLKEICMTHKKCYLLVGEDSDPISTTTPEKQLKMKKNSDTGKKSSGSSKKRKEQKNRQDLKSGKTSSGKGKKGKKQKSRQDSESAKISSKHHKKYKKKEKFKQIIEVCQEQDQVIQPLDDVVDEQEKYGNSLSDVCIDQEMGKDGVCANATEQNQTEKTLLIKHSDVTGSENQSVERSNNKEQIGTCGTKKRKNKKLKITSKKSSKRIKKNEEAQLQVLSEANLKQDNEVTVGESHEQKQMIEVNMSDIQVQEENKDGEMALELYPDNSGYINSEQIQMKQNPQLLQLEKSPDSNHILQKNGKQIWTRLQLKPMSKKDALASSELTESPGNANMPKDKLDVVEYLCEEKQQAAPSAVSTKMNSQRAKLRSSQKSTVMESLDMQMEPPSLEKPLIELVEPTQQQEAASTQQPDELEEVKPMHKGRGRHPKKSQQSAKKVKVGNRRSKPKQDDDEVSGKSKSTNKKDQPKNKRHDKHKMPSKSSKKKRNPSR